MVKIKGITLSLCFFSSGSFAAFPDNVLITCSNGMHATLKSDVLSVEGIFNLPFEHIQSDDREKVIIVFADKYTEAKIMMRYADAKWFIQNTDRSWSPCSVRKVTQ